MTPAYVLQIGTGKNALFLAAGYVSSTHLSLTERRDEALALPRYEAEEIAAQYRELKVNFNVVELRA